MLMCIGERIYSYVSRYNIYNIQNDKEFLAFLPSFLLLT